MNLDLKYFDIPLKIIKRVRYFDYVKETSRCRIKADFIKKIFFYLNIFFNSFGLDLHKIELKEHVIGEETCIEKLQRIFTIKKNFETMEHDELPLIIQEAKDRANMSEKNYIRFRKTCSKINSFKLPSLFKLNEFKFRLNKFFTIIKNEFGFYVEPDEKIKWILNKLYHKENFKLKNNIFRLHLSGDGMAASKTRVNLINFTFRVLNENNQKTSSHYILGIFKVKCENYETLSCCLNELITKIQNMQSIEIENQIFKIEWTTGGDLKWLANIHGIKAANSNNPCVWCPWNCQNSNNNQDWSISERTHELARVLSDSKKDGYKNISLLPFIAFEKTVVDPLHMGLRITDKIFKKLLHHLEFLDNNSSIDLNKRPLFKKLWNFFENECGLTTPFEIDKNTSTFKMRSLNQNERIKILDTLKYDKNLLVLFDEKRDDSKIKILNFILIEFYDLFLFIKQDHTEFFDEESLKLRLQKWLSFWLKASDKEKLTPYLHIFIHHVPEFIRVFRNLNVFSTQGLEKLNDEIKCNYIRQTNKLRETFVQQLLEKSNRIEFFNLKGTSEELAMITELRGSKKAIPEEKSVEIEKERIEKELDKRIKKKRRLDYILSSSSYINDVPELPSKKIKKIVPNKLNTQTHTSSELGKEISSNSIELCTTSKLFSSKSSDNAKFTISDLKNLSLDTIKNEIESIFESLSEILFNKKYSWRHELYLKLSKKNKNKLEKSDGFSYFSQKQMIFIHQEIKEKLLSLDLSSNNLNANILATQSPKTLKESYIMNVILPEFLLRLVSKNVDLNLSEIDSKYFCLEI